MYGRNHQGSPRAAAGSCSAPLPDGIVRRPEPRSAGSVLVLGAVPDRTQRAAAGPRPQRGERRRRHHCKKKNHTDSRLASIWNPDCTAPGAEEQWYTTSTLETTPYFATPFFVPFSTHEKVETTRERHRNLAGRRRKLARAVVGGQARGHRRGHGHRGPEGALEPRRSVQAVRSSGTDLYGWPRVQTCQEWTCRQNAHFPGIDIHRLECDAIHMR